ncbi:putative mitochondrial protein, partial [Tanacetum coccineum]
KELRMTFVNDGRSVTIKGETGMIRTLVSLKSLVRSLQKEKKGFLVEMKQLDDTQAEATTTETSIEIGGLLAEYEDVFNLPSGLPPSRDHEHSIVLKDGTTPISVRPYRYPHIQKNEIEKLVKEMLAAVGSVEYKALSAPSVYYWEELLRDLERDAELEPLRKKVLEEGGSCTGYTMEDGRLLYRNMLVLPRTSQWIPKLFPEFHSSTTGGHEGSTKTYHRMASEPYWSGMRKDIARMVLECVITMDFIDGLPKSDGFTVILVVVDRLSKYAHFVPLRHPYTASTVAATFMQEVIRLHGVPKAMVTDRDKSDSHRREVQFLVGDMVYRQRSVSKRLNEKLAPRYFGPFEVVEKIGTVAYRLKLPDTASIHPVFHVSQLKKLVGDQVAETNFPKELLGDMEMRV